MKFKYKPGQLVSVIFHDHCRQNGDVEPGVLTFEAVGRIKYNTKLFITLSFWHYSEDLMDRDENCEEFTIVKKAIVNVKKLS